MKTMQLSCTSGPVMANGAFLAVVVEFGDKLIFVRFPWVGCFFVFVVVLFCFFVCLCYNIILSKLKDSRNA